MEIGCDMGELRSVEIKDLELLFLWTNDTEVRNNSFSNKKILIDEHKNWFFSKIKDPNCFMYIYHEAGRDKGVIRIDIEKYIATVSYSVDSMWRGNHIGYKMLFVLEAKILKDNIPVKYIHGYVKEENLASRKNFINAGYIEQLDKSINLYQKTIKYDI